eukprot:5098787-Lingulodinium_polyedra.AAC.1
MGGPRVAAASRQRASARLATRVPPWAVGLPQLSSTGSGPFGDARGAVRHACARKVARFRAHGCACGAAPAITARSRLRARASTR